MLFDIEHAEENISAIKTQFCIKELSIVGYMYDSAGRHPATAKIIKILEWEKEDVDLTSARAFIGVCIFYRIWIEGFAAIAALIYIIFRKNNFKWGDEQRAAMIQLKKVLTSPPALIVIDYSEGARIA